MNARANIGSLVLHPGPEASTAAKAKALSVHAYSSAAMPGYFSLVLFDDDNRDLGQAGTRLSREQVTLLRDRLTAHLEATA